MRYIVALGMLLWMVSLSTVVVFLTPGVYEFIQKTIQVPLNETDRAYMEQKNTSLRTYRVSTQRTFGDSDFTEAERNHLYDVKKVLRYTAFFGLIAIGCTVFAVYMVPYRIKESSRAALVWIGVITGAVLLMHLLGYFEEVFEGFHYVFFEDNWRFPTESLLIQLYPEHFFIAAFIIISLLTILFLSIFYFLSRWKRENSK